MTTDKKNTDTYAQGCNEDDWTKRRQTKMTESNARVKEGGGSSQANKLCCALFID